MLKVYPAIFHQEGGYWVEFPDLEGCSTCGATLHKQWKLRKRHLVCI